MRRRGDRSNAISPQDLTTTPTAVGLETTWGFMSLDII
jgi:hypothetical protein